MTCENCKKNCINTKSKPWLYLTPVLTLKNSFFIHFSWEASNTVKGLKSMCHNVSDPTRTEQPHW